MKTCTEIPLGRSQRLEVLIGAIAGGVIAFVLWFVTVLIFSLA